MGATHTQPETNASLDPVPPSHLSEDPPVVAKNHHSVMAPREAAHLLRLARTSPIQVDVWSVESPHANQCGV